MNLGVLLVASTVTVFASGDGGFPQIRIPSLLLTSKGTLIAMAEGRNGTASDQQRNAIVYRRSLDKGKSWRLLKVVAEPRASSYNNPCLVEDRRNGRLMVMYQRYPDGHKEADGTLKTGVTGPDIVSSWIVTSDDDGKTWSKPRNITSMVKPTTVATTVASGPGIGIQLTQGPHKGRLVIPFNKGPFYQWQIYAVYSDDGGWSWRTSKDAPGALLKFAGKDLSQVNEVQCVERKDGSLLMLSRQYAGAPCRRATVSQDGGATWSSIYKIPDLNDPSCMGSVIRLGDKLLFSGPDHQLRRNGTVWTSTDEGMTWPKKRVIVPGGFAYSVMANLGNGKVGCLYETSDYRRIEYTVLEGF